MSGNKEFTQICREILELESYIKNSGINSQSLQSSVAKINSIKTEVKQIRDQILTHQGSSGGSVDSEALNNIKTELKDEIALKLSIATAQSLYATKSELPNVDGLLSNETAEATYLKIEAANTKFATKQELASASLGGGDNSLAIEQFQNSINAKLGRDEAEGIYAKISEIPSVEGLLSAQTADDTYLKKVDKPNIDNLATKAELESYATKEQIPDVSSFITQTQGDKRYELKGQGGGGASIDTENFLQKSEAENIYAKKDVMELLESGKLGKSEKAADSALFNGNNEDVFVKHADTSETVTASSVVKRTADGSIAATNLNVSGNINLAGTTAEDGAMAANSHIVFVENDSKGLRRGNINKLKQLVAPDLSGYALKTELPNVLNYQTQAEADSRYAKKDTVPNTDSFSSYKTFAYPTDANSLYKLVKELIPYLNLHHQNSSGSAPANITSNAIDFDKGINFVCTSSSYSSSSFTVSAFNHNKTRNINKSGLIYFEQTISGFSSDFKVLNPDDFSDKQKALFSYFISPTDSKIYIQFAGNLK